MSSEHNNPPVTCGNGCDCLAQCGDTYAHAGLPKPPETEKAATTPAVPLGYINAGHLHEMQSGRLPYAYLYAAPGVGVEIPVYTSNAPTVPQGWAFSVSDDDDGTWLRVKSPGGREAAFSAVNGGLAHDNRRSIASRVLLELKEALAATPAPAPAQEQCNACLGTGRMVRDPDIGTDQECFVCDGAGYETAQEVGLTDDEIAAIWSRHARLNGDEAYTLRNHVLCAGRDIIAALRAKGAV